MEIFLSFGASLYTITYLSIAELAYALHRKDVIVLASNILIMFTKLLNMKTNLMIEKKKNLKKVEMSICKYFIDFFKHKSLACKKEVISCEVMYPYMRCRKHNESLVSIHTNAVTVFL